jgi:hypothetical protein
MGIWAGTCTYVIKRRKVNGMLNRKDTLSRTTVSDLFCRTVRAQRTYTIALGTIVPAFSTSSAM